MIKITGNTGKSIIADAIHNYNNAYIYAYYSGLLYFECYQVETDECTVKEFCEFVLNDLKEKTHDNVWNMIVLYTNLEKSNEIKILENCAKEIEEKGYVVNVVVITKR